MKCFNRFFLIPFILFLNFGCSVYMAGNQPDKKNTKAMEAGGLTRDYVIAELGAPATSTKNADGTRIDIHEFYEGSSSGWKIGRATFHAVADIFTLGLWEVVGTPTEALIKGDKVTARITYDESETVKEFKVLKVEHANENNTQKRASSESEGE